MRCVWLASVLLCAVAAHAKDVEQEIWLYEHGGATRHLDVTALDEATREALHVQMGERGFVRVAVDLVLHEEHLPMDAGDDAEDADDEAASRKRLREDLRVLLRNGGRFPEDYEPAASKTSALEGLGGPFSRGAEGIAEMTGALLLAYLDVKDDAGRAPIYESVLAELARMLRYGTTHEAAARLMTRLIRHRNDRVYAEIWRVLLSVGPPLRGSWFESQAPNFAGAEIAFVARISLHEDAVAVRLGAIEEGSPAARMGLAEGDAILEIDGNYPTSERLAAAEARIRAGDKLRVRVRRRDGKMELLEFEETPGTPNSGEK